MVWEKDRMDLFSEWCELRNLGDELMSLVFVDCASNLTLQEYLQMTHCLWYFRGPDSQQVPPLNCWHQLS